MVRVAVIGGINIDVLALVDRHPGDGDPSRIRDMSEGPGGKGANQAVAAARLGATVRLLGAAGDDEGGCRVLAHLTDEGVDCAAVRIVVGTSTGRVVGTVGPDGSKRTSALGGANLALTAADVAAFADAIGQSDVVICQLEPPPDAIEAALDLARAAGVATLLDLAPAQGPARALAARSTWVTGNLAEVESVTEVPVHDEHTARAAAAELLALGVQIVGVTVGASGQLVAWPGGDAWSRLRADDVVDTAGAGDAFAATLAVLLAEGESPAVAGEWASAASTLACRRLGAQAALPTRAEIEAAR